MAEQTDPKLSQHYRDLEPLEPPPALDQNILAASRRATPARNRRWYYSLAAAAVLVFAVAITLQIERERPDSESASQERVGPPLRLAREMRGEIKPATPPPESKPAKVAPPSVDTVASAPASRSREPRVASAPAPAPAAPPAAARARRADEAPAARDAGASEAPPPKPAASPEAPIQLRRETAIASYASRNTAEQGAAPQAVREPPDRWLDRIAELRSRGRHAEADKELAEFRRVYPNYQMSDVMRGRVEGR